MKLYAPTYYTDFSCIADKCSHSCCVGWEIDVDPATLTVYEGLTGGYSERIKESIDFSGDTPHFRLSHGDRCPHLDGRGLCRIISNFGESYLCDICREHPRFYNPTSAGLEVGLGMACEEAARVILSSDGYASLVALGDVEGEADVSDFDALPYRARIFDILQDPDMTFSQKEQVLSHALGVSLTCRTNDKWRTLLDSLEYLDEGHRVLFEAYDSSTTVAPVTQPYFERALAYFVYRHVTSAFDLEDLRASLGFGLFCVTLAASVAAARRADSLGALAEIFRVISEELEYSEENTEVIKAAFGCNTDKA